MSNHDMSTVAELIGLMAVIVLAGWFLSAVDRKLELWMHEHRWLACFVRGHDPKRLYSTFYVVCRRCDATMNLARWWRK